MENNKLTIGLLITVVITTIAIGLFIVSTAKKDNLGAASGQSFYQTVSFLQGFAGGARDQFSVSNVGALTLDSATGTTTLYAKSTTASIGARVVLEDLDGAGCSEIAILNGTIAAKTVTCP